MAVDLTKYTPKRSFEARFFDRREIGTQLDFGSANALFDWLGQDPGSTEGWTSIPAFTTARVVFRGQSNAQHGLSSSLYRLCRDTLASRPTTTLVSERVIVNAEQEVLSAMRREGLGRLMSDLELLQVLQHHGVPTRLIDVSTRPLEALFFAVDNHDSLPGRLFIVRLDREAAGTRLLKATGPALPWVGMAHGSRRSQDIWTQTLAVIDADPLDPRMRAQRGKFLVGGLNCRSAGRWMRGVSADSYPSISTLGINFLQQLRVRHNQSWPGTGWTITIPAEWKPHLRDRLRGLPDPITSDSMYPPVVEVARLAKYAARSALDK